MSRYLFANCSCGSTMLKPTERPPPSLQPRFAASITPGPPPVTTAHPASPKRRPLPRDPVPNGRRRRFVDQSDLLGAGPELGRDLRDGDVDRRRALVEDLPVVGQR